MIQNTTEVKHIGNAYPSRSWANVYLDTERNKIRTNGQVRDRIQDEVSNG